MPKRRYLETAIPVDNTYINVDNPNIKDLEAPNVFNPRWLSNVNVWVNRDGSYSDFYTGKGLSKEQVVNRVYNNYTPKEKRRYNTLMNKIYDIYLDRYKPNSTKHYHVVDGYIRPKDKEYMDVMFERTRDGFLIPKAKYGIHINPANRGKFTETMRRTGKTAEELSHSSNPLTRKRAIFALNARKWNH